MDEVVSQPVSVVPVVLDSDADGVDCSEHAPPLGPARVAELYSNHIEECIRDVLESRNAAVIACGAGFPRGRAMLCLPGAHARLACVHWNMR
jgi:hypothetical protein